MERDSHGRQMSALIGLPDKNLKQMCVTQNNQAVTLGKIC